MKGHFDCILGRQVCGWAFDPEAPAQRQAILVYFNGEKIAEGVALHHRPDLETRGYGDGCHAFYISLDDAWTQGQSGELLVVTGAGHVLNGCPATLSLPQLGFVPVPPPVPLPPLRLAVCAIVRNEGPYLLEWLAFHRLAGVEHFLIYDNESDDGSELLMRRLALAGVIEWVHWPDRPRQPAQHAAYRDAVRRLSGRCRWTAFIDADEFLHARRGERLVDILADFDDCAGLMVPWRLFGSNGEQDFRDDLVVRRFTRRGRDDDAMNHSVKTIVQTHLVADAGVHVPTLRAGSLVDEARTVGGVHGNPEHHPVPTAQRLVLHHYFTKSQAEWQIKRRRGRADEPQQGAARVRPDSHFAIHDLNEVEDHSLARQAEAIRAEMQRLRALAGESPCP